VVTVVVTDGSMLYSLPWFSTHTHTQTQRERRARVIVYTLCLKQRHCFGILQYFIFPHHLTGAFALPGETESRKLSLFT